MNTEELKQFSPYKNIIKNYFQNHIGKRRIYYNQTAIEVSMQPKDLGSIRHELTGVMVYNPEAALAKAFIANMFEAACINTGTLEYSTENSMWKIKGTSTHVENIPIDYKLNIPQDVWYDELTVEVRLKGKKNVDVVVIPVVKNSFKHPDLDKIFNNIRIEASNYVMSILSKKKGLLNKTNRWRHMRINLKKADVPAIKFTAVLRQNFEYGYEISEKDF